MEETDPRKLALAAAAFLDLRIEPALLDGVAANLALLQRHAAGVMDFALPAEEQIACVFRA